MKSTTKTLIEAMRILANEIHSEDGIANAAIFEAGERLEKQQERIAELESHNLGLTKTLVEFEQENLKTHGWIAKAMMQGLNKVDCSDELLKIIAIRDLEQQAKGAEDVIESVLGEPESLTSDALSIRYEFLDRLKQLREQAKQLKGGDI